MISSHYSKCIRQHGEAICGARQRDSFFLLIGGNYNFLVST
jgi:hypothetical protein